MEKPEGDGPTQESESAPSHASVKHAARERRAEEMGQEGILSPSKRKAEELS